MRASFVFTLGAALAGCNLGFTAGPSETALDSAEQASATLLATGGDGDDWGAIGFSYDEARHSPLTDINAANVAELGLAWSADLPDARGQEATPVVIDGTMYISTAWSKVFAFEAATGKPLWQFDPKVPGETAVNACCDVTRATASFVTATARSATVSPPTCASRAYWATPARGGA